MSNDQIARGRTEPLWTKSSYSGSDGGDCVEVAWRTSSRSGSDGGQCVEVGWRKSARSGNEGGQCVEVAACSCVHVRDSKVSAGPVLDFGHDQWGAFLGRTES